jgi:hypothetical protein
MEGNIQPVRKIRSSKTSLRGKVVSEKNNAVHDFESSLERDFIEILEFDSNVSSFVEQPVTIEFEENGIKKTYTPDFLIKYRKGITPANQFTPLLVEIKYSKELIKSKEILAPKFKAAEAYAQKKGWRFKVLTENEIRNAYLQNVKFLSSYKKTELILIDDFTLLLNKIIALRITTPQELILASSRTESKKAELLFTLWHMIANNYIACDLTNSLTMKSEIWARLTI